MDILTILKYTMAAISLILVVIVLLQVRSGGLGAVFGGSASSGEYRSKRGMEAVLYNLTWVLMVVFAVNAMAIAMISV